MSTNTIRLHRVLRAKPERVYRAFLDADAMAKWLPPNGFTGKVHQLDAKVAPPAALGAPLESAARFSNWCHTNGFATRTSLTTRG